MMHELIPYTALLWALIWYLISKLPARADTGNDVFARLLSYIGLAVFAGWALWAIWKIG